MHMTRKDFLQGTFGFAILGLLAPGCGDDDESGTTSGATSTTSSTTSATSSSDASTTTSSTSGTGGGGQGGSGGAGEGGSGQGGSGGAGQGGAGGGASASCLDNGTNVTIGGNHGHALTVSKDDVAAGVDKTYDIMGASGHTHSVTVTAADFALLAGNTTVMVTSTSGAQHTHTCTIVCA
jgi:hypothetical protein